MAYIILSIIGILAVLIIKPYWTLKWQIFFIFILLVIGSIIIVGTEVFFFQTKDVILKGIPLGAEISWIEIGLYFLMILGMIAKYLYDIIGEKKDKKVFHKQELLRAIVISPIIFGIMYAKIGVNSHPLILCTFSFQNGFFWQTILNKKRNDV